MKDQIRLLDLNPAQRSDWQKKMERYVIKFLDQLPSIKPFIQASNEGKNLENHLVKP